MFLALTCVGLLASCATAPVVSVAPMKLCADDERSKAIDPKFLQSALVEAQRYSESVYGTDCFVCAEVFVFDPSKLWLHITSPVPDMFINTSASIWVRRSDGKVVERSLHHSCHARIKSS